MTDERIDGATDCRVLVDGEGGRVHLSMNGDRGEARMEPGDRLPSISLARADGDGAVNLRHGGRDATVIVKLPAPGADRFLTYLERLADAGPTFRDWNGRLLVVLGAKPGGRNEPIDLDPSHIASLAFPVVRDDRSATGDWAAPGEAAVIVADRFGVVYHEAHGRGDADLPDADALVEWFRYLATQCPECGVPDEPGLGEYA